MSKIVIYLFLLNGNKDNTKAMKATIPQIGNIKKVRSEVPGMVALICKVDVSYVRKIINGKYKPRTEAGKLQAAEIKNTYNTLLNGKKKLVRETKKQVRA